MNEELRRSIEDRVRIDVPPPGGWDPATAEVVRTYRALIVEKRVRNEVGALFDRMGPGAAGYAEVRDRWGAAQDDFDRALKAHRAACAARAASR